jgi:hypothetical protein
LTSQMTEADLDRVYERCRVEGRLLGETLVEEGRLGSLELELALRRHSAECLVALCRQPKPTCWSPRRGRGYAPRFTFRAVDLLFEAAASLVPQLQEAAQNELALLGAPGRSGAAYFIDQSAELAVPLAERSGSLGVEKLATVGQWALSLPRASREFGAQTQFTLASTTAAETLAVWWRDSLLFVVWCDDRTSVAAITAHHLGRT